MNPLLAAIAADPDAIENWLVYADWLIEHDDPRGELIVLELALEAKVANKVTLEHYLSLLRGDSQWLTPHFEAEGHRLKRELAKIASEDEIERLRALLRDERAWLSPRLEAESHHLGLQLWRGFIHRAQVFGPADGLPTQETLAALFEDPHACVLRALNLHYHVDLLDGVCSPSVRELRVDVRTTTELLIADALPSLEMLDLTQRAFGRHFNDEAVEQQLTYLGHPRVRELHGSVHALETGNFDLPNLESFHVANPRALFGPRGILQAPPPRLAHLVLDTEEPSFVDALRASPLCAQLRSLATSLSGPIVDAFARDPSAFSHIALKGTVWLGTKDECDALLARFRTLFPAADVGYPEATLGEEDLPQDVESEPPATIDPDALQGIGDAVMRLVEKMKARQPKR